MINNIIRALRLPFITASIIPFIFGSLIMRQGFDLWGFVFGLIAVVATHLSANLVNDYADSKSGADWQDKNFYKFFGGSKLIQEGVFPDKFYLKAAIFFAIVSSISIILLAITLDSFSPIIYYSIIILLSWSYSQKPLQFSYHRLGEVIIFLLFGPALVMGGYFIQTRIFPAQETFSLSLPFGFLTTAVLFANEVPDLTDDAKVRKFTWAGLLTRQRAFILYWLLVSFAFLSILLNIALGYLNIFAFPALIFIFPALKAANILRKFPDDKARLIESSKLTIAVGALVSIILIVAVIL